jgi:ATP-binding cassette subfamily B protein
LGLFGLLTQEFGRYEFTVRETVSLGSTRTNISDADLWRALDAAHASEFVRTMPGGLNAQLGEQWGGVGVSGGQWQRLALARIYLRDAPIWVLDEPTSAIDAETEYEVFRELQATKDKRITIVVSHRAWTLKGMDRIYVLDAGEVVECGTYEALSAAGGRFAEMFAEQK